MIVSKGIKEIILKLTMLPPVLVWVLQRNQEERYIKREREMADRWVKEDGL